jgi:ribosomal protein L7/L12
MRVGLFHGGLLRRVGFSLLAGLLLGSSALLAAPQGTSPVAKNDAKVLEPLTIPLFEKVRPAWARSGNLDVEVQAMGSRTKDVIRVVGSFAGLNDKFVTRMLQDLPVVVLHSANKERAEKARRDLEAVGATVKLIKSKTSKKRPHPKAVPAGSGSARKSGSGNSHVVSPKAQ